MVKESRKSEAVSLFCRLGGGGYRHVKMRDWPACLKRRSTDSRIERRRASFGETEKRVEDVPGDDGNAAAS